MVRILSLLAFLPLVVLATEVNFGVDGSNNTVAVWTSINSSTGKQVVKGGYFPSGQTTPSNVQTLSSTSTNSFKPKVSVNTSGQAAVAWITDDTSLGVRTIEYTFFDATNLWHSKNTLTNTSENLIAIDQIFIMTSGEIVLVWDSVMSNAQVSRYSVGNYSTFSYGTINTIP